LESLIEQRDALKSSLLELVPVAAAAGSTSLTAGDGTVGGGSDAVIAGLTSADKAAGFDQTLIDDINAFFADAGSDGDAPALAPPSPSAASAPVVPAAGVHAPAVGASGKSTAAGAIITAAGKPLTTKLNLRQLLISPRPVAPGADGAAAAVGEAFPAAATATVAPTSASAAPPSGALQWRQRPVSEE
jgi:hypothetical protein